MLGLPKSRLGSWRNCENSKFVSIGSYYPGAGRGNDLLGHGAECADDPVDAITDATAGNSASSRHAAGTTDAAEREFAGDADSGPNADSGFADSGVKDCDSECSYAIR